MWLFVRYLVALYSPPFWEWLTAPIICSIVHLWNTTPFCVENNYLAGGRKPQLEVFKSDFLRSSANKVWTLPNQDLLESQQKKHQQKSPSRFEPLSQSALRSWTCDFKSCKSWAPKSWGKLTGDGQEPTLFFEDFVPKISNASADFLWSTKISHRKIWTHFLANFGGGKT